MKCSFESSFELTNVSHSVKFFIYLCSSIFERCCRLMRERVMIQHPCVFFGGVPPRHSQREECHLAIVILTPATIKAIGIGGGEESHHHLPPKQKMREEE